MCTSGTTGLPKGCVLTQGYYLRAVASVVGMLAVDEDDRLYSTLPLFHAGGRMLILATALLAGQSVAIDSAFSDRMKDSLRRRGENVSSMELEVAIRAHPLNRSSLRC